jgi:hypothetical protein
MNPDIRQLLRQAQRMQEQMAAAQADLADRTFEGSSGGGAVKAVVSGANRLLSVAIAAEVIDPSDPEMLEDLVVAAVNQALVTAAAAASEQLGGLAGGLDLGGLFG